MATCSPSSEPDSVFEGYEFSDADNILLMTLMEETQDDQDHDLYYADDRLMSMIQSLEAEIISSSSASGGHYQRYDEVGQVDFHDCSTSSSISFGTDDWADIEVVSDSSSSSSSLFDEDMMNAWSPCAAGVHDSDYSGFYYGVLMETYLPQEASDAVF